MKPNLSKILKELRASNSKTQREIAEFLGISRQAYSRYESSLREPGMDTLSKLAKYYNVSPQIFFMGQIDKPINDEMDIVELSAIYQARKAVYSSESKSKTEKKEVVPDHTEEIDEMKKKLFTKLDIDVSTAQPGIIKVEDNLVVARKKKIRKIKKYILYVLLILFTINIGMMTIHRLDTTYDYPIFNHSYVNAISPGQNVNQTMYTDIVKINKFNSEEALVGDLVIIYSDFGIDEYWVEEITAIDQENQEISTTYDQITAQKIKFKDVLGSYNKQSNFIGTLYYTAKFNTGFLFLVTGHLLLLAFYYYTFLDENGRYVS